MLYGCGSGSEAYEAMQDACDTCPYNTTCSVEKDSNHNIVNTICTF